MGIMLRLLSIDKNGTYTIEQDQYEMSINYTYSYSSGTHDNPPEADMDITSVYLNGMNITEFYWNYVDELLHTELWEHAQQNN